MFANTGSWSQIAYVKPSNTEVAWEFGHAISLAGDGSTLLVGAINESAPRRRASMAIRRTAATLARVLCISFSSQKRATRDHFFVRS